MTTDRIEAHTRRLAEAVATMTTTPLLSGTDPALTPEEGYAIQAAGLRARIETGEVIVGAKLGLTSKAKQVRMSVDVPIFGWLTDANTIPSGQPLVTGELIHPRVEPEIVFVLATELRGPGVEAADVLRATESVRAGLEVIDSRYADFKFTLADVVADNTSASRYVISDQAVDVADIDLIGCAVALQHNGADIATATGADVLGDPAAAVAMLANHLAESGLSLRPGWFVLSGALTDAVAVAPGDTVTAVFSGLRSITLDIA